MRKKIPNPKVSTDKKKMWKIEEWQLPVKSLVLQKVAALWSVNPDRQVIYYHLVDKNGRKYDMCDDFFETLKQLAVKPKR